MIRTSSRSVAAMLLAMLPVTGCSVFLPAHGNSQKSRDERVTIEMLTLDEMKKGEYKAGENTIHFKDLYLAAFGVDLEPAVGAKFAPLAAAVPFVAGLAIDAVVSQLQAEATLYEAQFGDTKAFSGFWIATSEKTEVRSETIEDVFRRKDQSKDFELQTSTKTVTVREDLPELQQHHYGLKIARKIIEGGQETDAFVLVVGIAPSPDGQMFQLAPLLFWAPKVKAKVLSDEYWTWLPPMLLGKLIRKPGHHVDTTVNIQIDAYWRGADQQLHTATLAAIPMSFASYSIDDPKPLKTPWKRGGSGWLLAVPVSYGPDGKIAKPRQDDEYGTFSVKVLVTERDQSNAKRFLEQGATYLKEHKADIIKQISP